METVCNALFGRYLDQFLSFVEHNIKIFKDCPAEFILMKENVEEVLKLIEDVENADHGMKSLEHLTNQLTELMYEADDRVADYSHMSIAGRLGVGIKLEDINEKLKEMKSKLENSVNAILARGGKSKREDVVKRRQSLRVNDVTKIVGLEDAVSKIKEWILNKDQKIRKVHYNCIGLVGIGGSGKTTLAQMILKDEQIKNYFDLKMMFVTVSQPVDVKMMMKNMIKQLTDETNDDDDEGDMSEKINEYLKGKRYFVILDDVWSLDGGWWETIKETLPEGSENCVLVTSRNERNVLQMGVVGEERIHVPKALEDEDGWTLFCKNISTDDVSKDTTLKEIGMEIVKQCCGLPLAIKVMGAVVSSYRISPPKWMEIRDNFKQHIFKNENDIVMGSLGLSYDDLRGTYLQQCLLCFGVFPEDRLIQKDTMIRWWIGEGFVPLTEDGRLSVDLAEKCFEELVNRSLVEVVQRDYKGQVLECKVHDLVRDMLIRKGKSKAFFEIGKEKISRRISLDDDLSVANNQISASKNKVRAIVETSDYRQLPLHGFTKELLHEIFNKCIYLRFMSVRISQIKDTSESTFKSIGNLKHLKCLLVSEHITDHLNQYSQTPKYIPPFTKSILVLCLSIHSITTLPDSITELKQLIWLDVHSCTGVSYLPKGLGNVSTLQVLKGFKLSSPPSTTKGSSSTKKGSSSSKSVLKLFKPSSPSTDKECRFEELRKLTQLVTLEMSRISDNAFSDSELNALSELDGLRHLSIHFDQFVKKSVNLDKLVLPKNLDEVKLEFYPGEKTPSWLNTEDLPILRCLSLSGTRIRSFHDKFYQGKNWGIAHLELDYLHSLMEDWNVVLERLPYLETLYSYSRLRSRRDFSLGDIRLENFPSADEFDDEGVWRNPKKRA